MYTTCEKSETALSSTDTAAFALDTKTSLLSALPSLERKRIKQQFKVKKMPTFHHRASTQPTKIEEKCYIKATLL